MKKTILALIILLSINISVIAQGNNPNKFKMGLKVTPGLSWLNNNSQGFSSESVKMKFSWGLIMDFQFSDNYFFSTGVNLTSVGGKLYFPYQLKIVSDSIVGNLKSDFKIKYVELPVLLKMKTNEFGKFTFFGQIGAGLGIRVNAKRDDFFDVASLTYVSGLDKDADDVVNFFRLSLIFSLGTEYSLGKSTSLFGCLSFNNGFTNVFDFKVNVPPYSSADASSNALELSVGLMF